MEVNRMLRILLPIFIILLRKSESLVVKKYSLLMPNVYPDRDELYLCTPVRVNSEKKFYIVGFEPNASMHTVHHMMLFGCPTPGTYEPYWDCGEMAVSASNALLKRANPCLENSSVLYAWARDAKTLELPEDVGFQVGSGTNIEYLVLQVHYSKKFQDNVFDNSGTNLLYTEEPRKKLAGVLLLGTGGAIPPKSVTHMEAKCEITEKKTIYPFAYRTHTHSLGKVVSGYKVHRGENNEDHWTLLGKRDPLTPQMFYPVFSTDPIKPGDKVASRCTMASERATYTHVGPTNNDEMCNFYLMYYVKDSSPLDMKFCITEGPPYFYWNSPGSDLNNIPDKEASTL